MKKYLTLFPSFLLFNISSFSQEIDGRIYETKTIAVTEEVSPLVKDSAVNAFVMEIPETRLKVVKKEWISFISKGARSKAIQEGDKIIITDAKKERLSAYAFPIYSLLTESSNGVKLTASFFVDSNYVSSTANEQLAMVTKKILVEFGTEQYKDAVTLQVKNEKNQLSKLKDELDDLQSDNKKMKKQISNDETRIKSNREEIEVNNASAEKLQEEYIKQKATLTLLDKKSEAYKAQNKAVKELESEKNKFVRSTEKLNSDIIDRQEEIKQLTYKIGQNEKDQEISTAKVEVQKKVVEKMDQKLGNIK